MSDSGDVVEELIAGRRAVYGNPEETFKQHAKVWSGILGTEVRPDQVVLLLIAYKLVRASITPDYSDNIDDVFGYADIFRKVMGESMIPARTVDEYILKKIEKERRVPTDEVMDHNRKAYERELQEPSITERINKEVNNGN